jgi:hypothetical protein
MIKTYSIGNLEVYRDLLGEDTFKGATERINSLGQEWRLPDPQELLYILSLGVVYKVGGYSRYTSYWSREKEMGEVTVALVWSNLLIQLGKSNMFKLHGIIAVRNI